MGIAPCVSESTQVIPQMAATCLRRFRLPGYAVYALRLDAVDRSSAHAGLR